MLIKMDFHLGWKLSCREFKSNKLVADIFKPKE